jgi:hypothetical protein
MRGSRREGRYARADALRTAVAEMLDRFEYDGDLPRDEIAAEDMLYKEREIDDTVLERLYPLAQR